MKSAILSSEGTFPEHEEAITSSNPGDMDDAHLNASWKSLFNFTTRKHILTLIATSIVTIAAGITTPAFAIFLGNLFEYFTKFGAGTISDGQLLVEISSNCLALLGLGAVSWDIEWFETRKGGVGAFLSDLQAQIRELQMGTSQPLGLTLQYSVRTVASLGLAFYTSWSLTLVTLAAVPFCSAVVASLSSKMQYSIKAQRGELTNASKLSYNAFASIDTVKCFNGQFFECRQYSASISAAACYYLKQACLNALQKACIRLMMFGMFVQGFWYGSSLVGSMKISAGDVLRTFWACLVAAQSIEQVVPHIIVLEKGKAAGASLKAILQHLNPDKPTSGMTGMLYPQYCEGDIEVEDVSFAYPSQPGNLVLKSSSFFFPAGETTFVVGRSGSGKSTLGNLLMRFYSPTSGEILIDGNPIDALDMSWIRNNITLVLQRSILLNETIFRNIAFGCRLYDRVEKEHIKDCIDLAMLQSTIDDMPDGLDTVVGAGGSALSGGQRQRVAIARARLRDTPILILDESTSALDYTSRTAVMQAIRKWRKGKTTIIITHDMSQILEDDFFYVLDHGSVVYSGYRKALERADEDENIPFLSLKRSASNLEAGDDYLSAVDRMDSDSDTSSIQSLGEKSLNAKACSRQTYLPTTSTHDEVAPETPSPPYSETTISQPDPPDSLRRESTGDKLAGFLCTGPYLGRRMSKLPLPEIYDLRYSETATETTVNSITNTRAARDSQSMTSGLERTAPKSSMARDRNWRWKSGNTKKERRNVPSIYRILLTIIPRLTISQRILLILGFTCALMHATATPIFAYMLSQLLDTFSLPENRAQAAMKWSLAVLGLSVCDATVSYLMHYLLEYCGQAWVDALRRQAMSQILDRPRSWFERDENQPSNLTACLDQNAEEMRDLVGRFAGFALVAITIVVIAVIWSFVICWKMTLVGLSCGPIMYGITKGFESISGKWEKRSNDVHENIYSIFSETFSDIRTVRSLTLESYFHKKHIKSTAKAMQVGLKRAGYTGVLFGLSESAIMFASALIFYYGAVLASSRDYTSKEILTVFAILLFSIGYASTVLSWIPQMSSSRNTAIRLLRLVNPPRQASHEHVGKLSISDPTPIKFTNLNFRYPRRPDTLALRDFSLTIPANTCTAIVGRSGSGKSTIASLLLSLYEAPHPPSKDGTAALSLGGIDIRHLHTSTLRSLISIVPQQPTLFPDTISANISYGLDPSSPLNTLENIHAAAQAAGIHEFIESLPWGYATVVGDGGDGIGLSGGQAQRVVIARALVRRPRILILDEATSSLDRESTEVIRQTVRRLVADGKRRLTVIIITHAKEMMEIADNIVVVDQGRVVEGGPYRVLAKRPGGKLGQMLMLRAGGDFFEGEEKI
ncbi:hypothetical protein VTN00DRAFT_875 [Thermoascus crustaceus]|uniref:uncharacterized protein n=1 Tax=Thermoascus crustaceus TaxID=5088 RepID=UPI0037442154